MPDVRFVCMRYIWQVNITCTNFHKEANHIRGLIIKEETPLACLMLLFSFFHPIHTAKPECIAQQASPLTRPIILEVISLQWLTYEQISWYSLGFCSIREQKIHIFTVQLTWNHEKLQHGVEANTMYYLSVLEW